MARKPKIERFNESVLSKFQIYNSLFLTLPFDSIRNIFRKLFNDTLVNEILPFFVCETIKGKYWKLFSLVTYEAEMLDGI